MYKVFFKDRIVFFIKEDPISKHKEGAKYYTYESVDLLEPVLLDFYYQDSFDELYLIHKDIDLLWKNFKSVFKLIKAGGGLVMNEKAELLFIKRNGIWDLPKGKLEKNESFEQGALREVKEECGIKDLSLKKQITSSYHTYFLKGKFILKRTEWFEMESSSREDLVPQTKEDITDVIWVDVDNLSYLTGNTYSSIIDVLKSANFLKLS